MSHSGLYLKLSHKKFNQLIKAVSLLIITSLSLNTMAWAFESPQAGLAGSRPALINHLGKTITIPEKFGTIANSFQGGNQTILCIQDLHCHYEVQKNIAAIISHLNKRHNLKLIGEEGGYGPLNVDVIKDFPLADARQAVSDHYVKEGRLTGAEYFTANHDGEIYLEGVETEKLYKDSYAAIQTFLNAESQGYCFDLRDALEEIKSYVYNSALYQYDQKRVDYRNGDLDLLKYAVFLRKSAKQLNISLSHYGQVNQFLALKQTHFTSEVDAPQLLSEIDTIDDLIRGQLYTDPVQEELDRLISRLDIMEKLLNISVTPEELEQFRANRTAYQVKAYVEFIKKYDQEAIHYFDNELYGLDDKLKKVEVFYELADKRSKAFVDHLLQKMSEKKQSMGLMVNGGFHIDKIMEELKARNISFVSIKPTLTRQDIVNPYFNLLQGKKSPLERLLAQNQHIFAPELAPMRPRALKREIETALDPIGLFELESLSTKQREQVLEYIRIHQVVALNKLTEIEDDTGVAIAIPDNTQAFEATVIREGVEIKLPLVITRNKAALREALKPESSLREVGDYKIALLSQRENVAEIVQATAPQAGIGMLVAELFRALNLGAIARSLWDLLQQPVYLQTLNSTVVGRVALAFTTISTALVLSIVVGEQASIVSIIAGSAILGIQLVDDRVPNITALTPERETELVKLVQSRNWLNYRNELESRLRKIINESGNSRQDAITDLMQFISDLGTTIRNIFPHDRIEPYYLFLHAVVRLRFIPDIGPELHKNLMGILEKNFKYFHNNLLPLKVLLQYGIIPRHWSRSLEGLGGRPLDLITAEIFPTGGGLSHVIKTIMDGFEHLLETTVNWTATISDPNNPFGSQQTVWTVYYPNRVKTDGQLEANKLDGLGLRGISETNTDQYKWVEEPQVVDTFDITMPNHEKPFKVEVLEGFVKENGVRVRFIKQPEFLPVLYAYESKHNPNGELESNFFLYKAMRKAMVRRNADLKKKLGAKYKAPVTVGNDGQTGLLGAYPGFDVALTAYVSHTFWNRQFMNYDLEKFKMYCRDAGIPEHIAAQAIYNNDRADFSGFGISATMEDTPTASTYVSKNQRNFLQHDPKMESIKDKESIGSSIGNGDDLATTYQPVIDAYKRLQTIKQWLNSGMQAKVGHETIGDLKKKELKGYYRTREMKFLEHQVVKQIGFEWTDWLVELKQLSGDDRIRKKDELIRLFKARNGLQDSDMTVVSDRILAIVERADSAIAKEDLAVEAKKMAEEFYYSLFVDFRVSVLNAKMEMVKKALNNHIKNSELDLAKPETLSWQEIALMEDYGRFAFAEGLDNEGIKRFGFELEGKFLNARHHFMREGWANALIGGLSDLVEDGDLREELAQSVDDFLTERRERTAVDPNDTEAVKAMARQAAEFVCDKLTMAKRKKLLKPMGFYINPLKPYCVYPGRLVDEKFGGPVIAQLERLAKDGYQFVGLARFQQSHLQLKDQFEQVVKNTKDTAGAIAFVPAYTPELKLLAFLGAAAGATPSLRGTGTSEIMEAKGPLALNVTYASVNQAYGFLGQGSEEEPVYDIEGEGSLAEAYAKKAKYSRETGQIEFEGERDFDVILSPGGEEDPAGFIDTLAAVMRDYNYDFSQNYDTTQIDQLKLIPPMRYHLAGEPVGSAWNTAAESLMYYNEKITAYEQAKSEIVNLINRFKSKLENKFSSNEDKISGINKLKDEGLEINQTDSSYTFNINRVSGFNTPEGMIPRSNGLDDFLSLIKAISYGGRYGDQDFPGQINALFNHLQYGGFRQQLLKILGEDLFAELADWLLVLEADNKIFGQREKFDLFMNLITQVDSHLNQVYQGAVEAAYQPEPSPVTEKISQFLAGLESNPNKVTIVKQILEGAFIFDAYKLANYGSSSKGLIGFSEMLEALFLDIAPGTNTELEETTAPHFNEGWFFDYLSALNGIPAYTSMINDLRGDFEQEQLTLLQKVALLKEHTQQLVIGLQAMIGEPSATGTIPGLEAMVMPMLNKLGITSRAYVNAIVPFLEIFPLIAYTLYGLISGDWLGSYTPLIVFGLFTAPRIGVFKLAHYWRGSSTIGEQAFQGRLATAESLSVINSVLFIVLANAVLFLSFNPAYMAVILLGGWWITHTVANVMATSQPRAGEVGKIISLITLLGKEKTGEAFFKQHIIGEKIYQAGKLIFGTQNANELLKNNIQVNLGDGFEVSGHAEVTAKGLLEDLEAQDVGFKISIPYGYRMLLETRPTTFFGGLAYAYQSWMAGLIIARQLRVYANDTKAMTAERTIADQETAIDYGSDRILRLPANMLRGLGTMLPNVFFQTKHEQPVGVLLSQLSEVIESYRLETTSTTETWRSLVQQPYQALLDIGESAGPLTMVEAIKSIDAGAIRDKALNLEVIRIKTVLQELQADEAAPAEVLRLAAMLLSSNQLQRTQAAQSLDVSATGQHDFVIMGNQSQRLDIVDILVLLRQRATNRQTRKEIAFLSRIVKRGSVSSEERAAFEQLLLQRSMLPTQMTTEVLGEAQKGFVGAIVTGNVDKVQISYNGQKLNVAVPFVGTVMADTKAQITALATTKEADQQVAVMPLTGQRQQLVDASGNFENDIASKLSGILSQEALVPSSPLAQAYYRYQASKQEGDAKRIEREQRRMARVLFLIMKRQVRALEASPSKALEQQSKTTFEAVDALFGEPALFGKTVRLGRVGDREFVIPESVRLGGQFAAVFIARKYSTEFVVDDGLGSTMRELRLRNFRMDAAA